ncbi:MAG: M28 family peptidase [Gemmatimonadota bacterium]|nr:M28 family peptidase [Gemmatimonadota bacterium]
MRLVPLLAGFALTTACSSAPPAREFDGQTAFGYLQQQVAFGPRIPGTAAHARMAAWLDSTMRRRSDTVVVQAWNHVTARGDTLPLRNVIARFNPAATERVLFFAHWDTRPVSDNPTFKGDRTQPVPGANDGASGTAILIALADALRKQPAKVGVDLLFTDGEDYGNFQSEPADVLIGARYYAAHQLPGPKPLYAVLLDMVGDKELRLLPENQSVLAAPEVVDLVWTVAKEIGHGDVFVNDIGAGPTLIDDHVELQKVGIRAIDVVDFEYGAGNSFWHTPDDTIDKVSAQSLQVVGDVMMALIRRH